MDFTREPLIETVIAAKEGHKLLLRSSKGTGQEEFLVDAVEVVCFGKNCFYRSLEKPKVFLVPVGDYEVLEERDARVVLKSATVEHGIKIAGGREGTSKSSREERASPSEGEGEQKGEKRRERRRGRKPAREEGAPPAAVKEEAAPAPAPKGGDRSALIPPPSTLISETISRYRETAPHSSPEEAAPEVTESVDEGLFEEFLDHYVSEGPSEGDLP